ncbi:Ig-like domain-containing protein [Desulfosporosinus orientis DSM 765]|uniref:Ig-like domain-containing protein n=1 Tax=Desulfosporosinus orientis (strain ATCC 19365 / DSM 765 / NCIMB 8382 / VKM B-1628 / Singapore I) TaxID=768706 RepID=G7W9E6_DESOD|nr:Ig-like domain-containing protein [Desulfosporosinus orientis]AET69283.1 Ig-like domain-containing protein [Desulfosporosinus orientis DSM 765]
MWIDKTHNIKGNQTAGFSFITVCLRGLAALLMTFLLCLTGYLPVQAASPDDWYGVSGTFNQKDGNQYNSGKLQLLPLDNGGVLFELDVMQGSEAEDMTTDFRLSGTFHVEENGTGTCEEETESGLVSLRFVLDGDTVTVTQTGTLPVPVEGIYIWLEKSLEVTPESAGELLEGLATAATSLNHNNGEYRLEMSDTEVDGWFYDMKAVFADTGVLIGEFLIANDLSAVYRIDTETPILIYGSADSMMKAAHDMVLEKGEEPLTVAGSETDIGDGLVYSIPLVTATPSRSALPVGETAKVVSVTPGNVPAMITCTSENPEVASVDADGVITGISPGTATITGTLSVDGSEKAFSFDINVWVKSIQGLDIKTNFQVGETFKMNAQPIGVSDPINWSVSNTDLAEIDASTGVFTGKKEGQLTLIAQSGDLKQEWDVKVGSASASSDVGAKATSNSGFLLASIVGSLLVIGVVALVLIKQKQKHHNP